MTIIRNSRWTASARPDDSARSADLRADAEPRVGQHRRSAVRESFRQTRANMSFLARSGVGALAITSCLSGEGRTTSAVYLALSFAEAGERVLLIDGDLRRPRLAEQFERPGSAGLAEVLAHRARFGDVVHRDIRPNITLLCSGSVPADPGGLLAGQAMTETLAILRRDFPVIIIDTPALLAAADGALLASRADRAVMVVRYGQTATSQITRGMSILGSTGTPLLGCIFGQAPSGGVGGSGYQYGFYDDPMTDSKIAAAQPDAAAMQVDHIQPELQRRRHVDVV